MILRAERIEILASVLNALLSVIDDQHVEKSGEQERRDRQIVYRANRITRAAVAVVDEWEEWP